MLHGLVLVKERSLQSVTMVTSSNNSASDGKVTPLEQMGKFVQLQYSVVIVVSYHE